MDTPTLKTSGSKVTHTLKFRCVTCKKSNASEEVMKQHIRQMHCIQDPNSLHYGSFIGVRKPRFPESATSGGPGKVSLKPPLMYQCEMCDKQYRSVVGVKTHLESHHEVIDPALLKGLYSRFIPQVPSSSSRATFVSPLLETNRGSVTEHNITNKVDLSHHHSIAKLVNGMKKNTESDKKAVPDKKTEPEKMTESKKKTEPEKKIEPKKKTEPEKKAVPDKKTATEKKRKESNKIGFSKSLANIFLSGNIKMNKFSLWDKKKEKEKEQSKIPCGESSSVDLITPKPLSPIPDSPLPPEYQIGIFDHNLNMTTSDCLDKQIEMENLVDTVESDNQVNMIEFEMNPENLFYEHPLNGSVTGGPGTVKRKYGAMRKRKVCDDTKCQPCGVRTDCMKCKYCNNRNLK